MTAADQRTRVAIGSTWGRWTVLAYTQPAQRSTEVGRRARVLVRCVCGLEKPVFECDLKVRRTTGCRGLACRYGWLAEQRIIAMLKGQRGGPGRPEGSDG